MKKQWMTLAVLVLAPFSAHAQNSDSHGGDPCEERFKNITKNLSEWIDLGGAKALTYPAIWDEPRFRIEMQAKMKPFLAKDPDAEVVMACVTKPVYVGTTEKTCTWRSPKEDKTILDGKIHVECNFNRFFIEDINKKESYEPEQFKQTIHEWASIVGAEPNVGGSSDYFVTDQITSSGGDWAIHYQLSVKTDAEQSVSQNVQDLALMRKKIESMKTTLLKPSAEDYANYSDFLLQPRSGLGVIYMRGSDADAVLEAADAFGAYFFFGGFDHDHHVGNYKDIELSHMPQVHFSVGFSGVDYGLMSQLGEIDIRKIDASNEIVSAALAHQPPNQKSEAAWRAIQDRLTDWEGVVINGQRFTSAAFAKLGESYVVRSVIPGYHDIVVAFQVVRIDPVNGSWIIAWKIIREFSFPTIAN